MVDRRRCVSVASSVIKETPKVGEGGKKVEVETVTGIMAPLFIVEYGLYL